MFKPVTREQNKLRLALDGPSGAGKTFTALRFAFGLIGEEIRRPDGRLKVAVIDTEHGTAKKYHGDSPDGVAWDWEGVDLQHFAPSTYEQAINEAGRQGFDVVVIDSLSHAWIGSGGALDQVDKIADRTRNSFTAWRDVTPQHRAMVEAIVRSPCHVIVTLRSKMEYVMEKDAKTNKTTVSKVGLKPIQREGVEYEFDIVGDMDLQHKLTISKTRCSFLDGKVISCPDAAFMKPVLDWLLSGVKPAPPAPEPVSPPLNTAGTSALIGLNNRTPSLESQHLKIKDLAFRLQWTPDKLRELLATRSYHRLADLTVDEADSLIQAMDKKLLEREIAAANF